jgi:Asp-tRNA(Asn)/Glu-tRNA(Gln) amidotransferase A subunit family amidase
LRGIAKSAVDRADGLPIGFQLVGGFGADVRLLEFAARYEVAVPWAGRWPALAED